MTPSGPPRGTRQGRVLVTGGCGFIGSHTLVELLGAGWDVTVVDNLSNSSEEPIARVERLTGKGVTFVRGDVRDTALLLHILGEPHDAVLHFAGLKAVGESAQLPLEYYEHNVGGTLSLCRAICATGVRQLVFSSSATVYGVPDAVPIPETAPVREATNPYGRSKRMIEQILLDLSAADPGASIGILRYFNPIGAHPSGDLGEDPNGIPNNLLPYLAQVAIGRLPKLSVYGADYPTKDGTGVRDYIHVVDLAKGHVAALAYLRSHAGAHVWNLGTGKGASVLEIVHAMEEVIGRRIPYEIVARRDADVPECWADPSKAERELGWKAERTLGDMLVDLWRWQTKNPTGYRR